MKTSSDGLNLIKHYEGERLTAYRCPAHILTIGFGHTGPDVLPGQTITKARAEALLMKDLARFEAGVMAAVKVPLNQHQFDALVAFAFNVGVNALRASTLLELLNAGEPAAAQAQFGRWNRAGGKVLDGLTARRAAEAALFGRSA